MTPPTWALKLPWDLIRQVGRDEKLDPQVLAALTMNESSGNPWAYRFEPLVASKGTYLILPSEHAIRLNISANSETMLQSSSFGLTQIMGFTARELLFQGMLTELFDPKLNLQYGARKFKKLLNRFGTEINAVAAYNAGSPRLLKGGKFENQAYVDRFNGFLHAIKTLGPQVWRPDP
jgi:hypothetical protein